MTFTKEVDNFENALREYPLKNNKTGYYGNNI